jgi:hypothetical protein
VPLVATYSTSKQLRTVGHIKNGYFQLHYTNMCAK